MKKLKRRMRGIGSVILIVVLILLLLPSTVSANPGWSYYRTITIDHNKVGADLTNFPVLVSLSGDWLKTTPTGNVGQADGGDIAFTDSGNTTKYDHEIEKYDGSAGTLVAWVRIPSLSSSTDTTILIWYGNADCADQWNATGVWDSDYKGVWHLKETSGTQYDSTSNDNDGTPNNGVTQGTTGQIDGADSFDGSNDYLSIPYSSNLNPSTYITVEYWFKASTSQPGAGDNVVQLVDNSHGFGDWKGWVYSISTSNGKLGWAIMDGVSWYYQVNSTSSVLDNNWHHAAGFLDGSQIKLYVDGALQETTAVTGYTISTGRPLFMGASWGGGTPCRYFNGTLDEVRISNTARSASWITTSYNNQNSPSTFHTLGSETDSGGEDPGYPVPEASTIALVGIGVVAVGGYIWYKRRKSAVKAN